MIKCFSASWLCILIIPFLGVLAALFMFVGSNAAWLGCHTMRDPLSRPDMLSVYFYIKPFF